MWYWIWISSYRFNVHIMILRNQIYIIQRNWRLGNHWRRRLDIMTSGSFVLRRRLDIMTPGSFFLRRRLDIMTSGSFFLRRRRLDQDFWVVLFETTTVGYHDFCVVLFETTLGYHDFCVVLFETTLGYHDFWVVLYFQPPPCSLHIWLVTTEFVHNLMFLFTLNITFRGTIVHDLLQEYVIDSRVHDPDK